MQGFLGTDYPAMLDGRDLPALERIVVLRGEPGAHTAWADFLAAAAPAAAVEVERRIDARTSADVSDLIFTSGTTGRPKGVITTHGQTLRVFEEWASIVGLTEGDRYLIVNPFFHTFGFKAGFIACLIKGATIVPHPVFDVPTVLARIAEERVTMLPGPPTLHQSILDHPDRAKLRPVVAAALRHRRGGRARRDDQPHAQRVDVRDDRHRLRAHRVDRCRHHVPRRRRRRDDRNHVGPRHPRHRSAGRRRQG